MSKELSEEETVHQKIEKFFSTNNRLVYIDTSANILAGVTFFFYFISTYHLFNHFSSTRHPSHSAPSYLSSFPHYSCLASTHFFLLHSSSPKFSSSPMRYDGKEEKNW